MCVLGMFSSARDHWYSFVIFNEAPIYGKHALFVICMLWRNVGDRGSLIEEFECVLHFRATDK